MLDRVAERGSRRPGAAGVPPYALRGMTRRGSLAAVAAVAALVAVWAAASGTSSSRVVSNTGVQSLVISILLPLALAATIGIGVAMVLGVMSRARGSEESEETDRGSRGIRALAAGAMMALLALMVWLIYTTRHARRGRFLGAAGGRGQLTNHVLSKPVPLNAGAFGSTSALIVAVVVLYLLRHRLRALWRGSDGPLSSLGDIPELYMPVPPVGGAAAPVAVPGPSADPRGEGDPRRAVLLAYQRFAEVMAGRGVPRSETETPFEYCRRLTEQEIAARAPVRQATSGLTSLFSSVRYGFDPVTPDDRAAAIDWLTTISRELGPGRDPLATGG